MKKNILIDLIIDTKLIYNILNGCYIQAIFPLVLKEKFYYFIHFFIIKNF